MLDLHHKIENVAPLSATPALVRLAFGIQFEGRIMVVVKRTERLVPRTHTAQRQVLADQGDNIDRVFYGGFSRFGMSGHRGAPDIEDQARVHGLRSPEPNTCPNSPRGRSPCPD